MLCHHCGKDIPEGNLYCPYCGTALSNEDERDSYNGNLVGFAGGFVKDIRNGTVLKNIRTLHFNVVAVFGSILCIVSLFLPCVIASANGNTASFTVMTIDEPLYVIALFIGSLMACFASLSGKEKFGSAMAVVMVGCSLIFCFIVHDMVNNTPLGIMAETGACVYVMSVGAWLTLLAFLFDLIVLNKIKWFIMLGRVTRYVEKLEAFGDKPKEAMMSLAEKDEGIAQEYAVLQDKLKRIKRDDVFYRVKLVGEFMLAHIEAFDEKDRAMMQECASYCMTLSDGLRRMNALRPGKKRINSAFIKKKFVQGGKALVKMQFEGVISIYDVLLKPVAFELGTKSLKRYLRKHRLLCVAIVCNVLSIIAVFLPYLSFVVDGVSLTFTGLQLDLSYTGFMACVSFVAVCMIITRQRWFSVAMDAIVAGYCWELFVRVTVLIKTQYGEYVHFRYGSILLLVSCTLSLITVIFGAKLNDKAYRKAKKEYKAASKVLKKMGNMPLQIMDDYFFGDNCPKEIAVECTTKLDAITKAKQKRERGEIFLAMKDFLLFAQKNINLFPEEQQPTLTRYLHYSIIAYDAGIRLVKAEEE